MKPVMMYYIVMDNIDIARRLKQLRTENGLSQEQFGEILGIKQSTCHRIEAGDHSLSLKHAVTLHEEFGISFNWLILGIGDPGETGEPQLIRLAWDLEKNDPAMKSQVIENIYQLKAEKDKKK